MRKCLRIGIAYKGGSRFLSTRAHLQYRFRLRPKVDRTIERKHWGTHPRQYVEVFQYNPAVEETIIGVHGGGWVDYSQQATDLLPVYKGLESNINMFSLDYRLSKPENSPLEVLEADDFYVKDPYHLIDVLQGLKYVLDNYKVSKIHLLGHSVGGFLILQLQDYQRVIPAALTELVAAGLITAEEREEQLIFIEKFSKNYAPKIDLINFFYLAGIYDIELCVEKGRNSSQYEFCYVGDAFTSKQHYIQSSPLTNSSEVPVLRSITAKGRHVLFNCFQDEYLGVYSPLRLSSFLHSKQKTTSLNLDHYNHHFGVMKHPKLHKAIDQVLNG